MSGTDINAKELNEAINTARQIRTHYRAFEKLSEMLDIVARSKQVIVEMEAEKKKIEGEIEGLKAQREKCSFEFEKERVSSLAELSREKQAIVDELEGRAKILRKRIDALEIEELDLLERVKSTKADADAAIELAEKARAEAEKRLAAVTKQLESIKAKL